MPEVGRVNAVCRLICYLQLHYLPSAWSLHHLGALEHEAMCRKIVEAATVSGEAAGKLRGFWGGICNRCVKHSNAAVDAR